jgi:hypothetical protein
MSEAHDDPSAHAARIERLLGDLRASVGPVSWQRVEELVARMLALHGATLGRTLVLVEQAGALDAELRARLVADELVGPMMALHGIHPDPPLERARAAVDRVRAHLGDAAGTIALRLDERGVLRATLEGAWRLTVPRASIDEALKRAIEEAAPELAAVEVVGVDWSVGAAAPLVQLDVARSRGGADRAP